MDNTITDALDIVSRERSFAFTLDQALLERTLHLAIDSATRRGHAIVASVTQVLPWHDPLDAFTACLLSTLGESFFWERAAENTALVGVGAATTLETRGEDRFHSAAAQWRCLMQDAVIAREHDVSLVGSGPTLFGGFAFDALAPQTDLWRGFPDGLLVLPSLLFSYGPEGTALTLNTLLDASDSVEQRTQELMHMATRLWTSLEQGEQEATQHEPTFPYLLTSEDLLPASVWKQRVADVASEIRMGGYEKVVLARGVRVQGVINQTRTAEFDITAVLRRLRRSYPGAYVFAMQRGSRFFVGATPERLVQAQDGNIYTMALAGSAPRGTMPQEDERIGESLLLSEKNHTEHAIVVAQVRDALAQHCRSVEVAEKPHLLKLKNVQHLETPIMGTLLPQRCILDVMADLHPTSAVGGFPRREALETIRRVEQLDRGWYAGPLGWIGARGYGEFAVALRSGLLNEHEATLFAGCGIVGGSEPESEYEESCLKLQVMLRSLGETC